MTRINFRAAFLATSLAATNLIAFASPALSEVLDQSNSASAVGSPFTYDEALDTRASLGASPADDSNSASARGNPADARVSTTASIIGANPTNDSNSASALGGPGTGPLASLDRGAPAGLLALSIR